MFVHINAYFIGQVTHMGLYLMPWKNITDPDYLIDWG